MPHTLYSFTEINRQMEVKICHMVCCGWGRPSSGVKSPRSGSSTGHIWARPHHLYVVPLTIRQFSSTSLKLSDPAALWRFLLVQSVLCFLLIHVCKSLKHFAVLRHQRAAVGTFHWSGYDSLLPPPNLQHEQHDQRSPRAAHVLRQVISFGWDGGSCPSVCQIVTKSNLLRHREWSTVELKGHKPCPWACQREWSCRLYQVKVLLGVSLCSLSQPPSAWETLSTTGAPPSTTAKMPKTVRRVVVLSTRS